MNKTLNKITYKKSGVNIKKADKLIDALTKNSQCKISNVLEGIGGFASLYKLNMAKLKNPVIVSGTDGVGTKLKIANLLNNHRYIGQDLLAMCVNDVITTGAKPLFFLDYLSTGKININLHSTVLKSISRACKSIDIPLIGGETAEMPGMYKNNEYDLAGFCVGIVDKKDIINSSRVKKGDIIIGFKSSGLHSNGFSLINKLIEENIISINKEYKNINLKNSLIKPTELYVELINILTSQIDIHGVSHITGGGITGNLPRIIPDKLSANINLYSWKIPKLFQLIQDKAKLSIYDMLETFNCGLGMIIIIDKNDYNKAKKIISKTKFKPMIVGEISDKKDNKPIVYIND